MAAASPATTEGIGMQTHIFHYATKTQGIIITIAVIIIVVVKATMYKHPIMSEAQWEWRE